uniref:G-protein coupled receptors family 1 profile domain-containing protein n=1 Tax=Philodina roseola TaxID=96448 RepID=B6S342_PHIRO|nr:hypothetical protein [Philodina roseola]
MSTLTSTLSIIQFNVIRYVGPTLFLIGTFGSIWNLILFSRKKFRTNSCCIYFFYSSIFSLIFLFTGLIPQFYAHLRSPDPLFNGTFCKLRAYLTQFSLMLCRWILTMACVDRSLVTSPNVRLRQISDVRMAQKILWTLIFIWICFPVHTLIFVDVKVFGFINCHFPNGSMSFYHSIYTLIFGGILPPLIMLISTKSLWQNLQRKREQRERMNGNHRRKESRDIQILLILFIQIFIFILSNSPWMITNLYLASTRSLTQKSTQRLAIESFVQFLGEIFLYFYPSLNFYTNTLFSKSFRHEFFSSIFSPFCRKNRRISPSSLTNETVRQNHFTMSTFHY